jgi:3-keto-5-aminohexanoate cleavage enzyme
MARKVWLEAALNGPWTKKNQPNIPVTVNECIADGIAVVKAGAAVIHIHAYDPETGIQNDSPDVYAAIIEGIKSQVDVIIYPTISSASQPGSEVGVTGAWRHNPADILGARGILEWAIVDPGSVNFSDINDIEADKLGMVYMNVESDIRAGMAVAEKYDLRPTFALYDPGFIRLGAAIAARYPKLKKPVYRFMFSDQFTFGFMPKRYGVDAYLATLNDCDPGAPWMIAALKGDVTPIIPDAVALGGHVRVGLEDSIWGSDKTNAQLVEAAASNIVKAGGALATAADIREETKNM